MRFRMKVWLLAPIALLISGLIRRPAPIAFLRTERLRSR